MSQHPEQLPTPHGGLVPQDTASAMQAPTAADNRTIRFMSGSP
jgi:hypothetical protein